MAQSAIGAQLYTLREFTQTPAGIAETFRKVKAMGYDAVQKSAFGPIDPAELRKLADNAGLAIVATHVGFEPLQTGIQAMIDEHRTIGCPHVAIGGLPQEYRSEDGYHRFAAEASEVGRKLKDAGLTFSYHNHSFELEKFGGKLALGILMDESDPEALSFEIDTYWIQHGGGDPAQWIRKATANGRAMPLVHFKDMCIVEGRQTMAEVGEGNLNWPAILDACRDAKVLWHLVEQDTCQTDPFDCLATSLRNLKAMGLE